MNYYDYGNATTNYYATSGLVISPVYTGVSIALTAFCIFAMWKIFVKAGKEGWRAIVPFYNVYTLFEITWGNGWLFLILLVGIIPLIGWIVDIVILIMTYSKLSKAFGKGAGFTVGLIFLSVVFIAILAFDDSTYLGVPNGTQANNNYNPNQMNQPVNQAMNNVTPEATSFCTNCGTQLPSGTTVCPNCGQQKTN